MTKDEALKMALEALEDMNCGWKYIRESHGDLYGVGWDRAQGKADDAIEALRQALAQPEQEPTQEIYAVLFAVEEAVRNGCAPWDIEAAFEKYKAKLKEIK